MSQLSAISFFISKVQLKKESAFLNTSNEGSKPKLLGFSCPSWVVGELCGTHLRIGPSNSCFHYVVDLFATR